VTTRSVQFGTRAATTKRAYLVEGIASQFGTGMFINVDNGILISYKAGQVLTGSTNVGQIAVLTTGPDTVSSVSTAITSTLKNVRAMAVQQIVSTVQTMIGSVDLLLMAIASMSIIAAFFGIMTTMFTTVNERTREIGLLKALGFTNRSVMTVFLSEAALTGLIGGLLGSTIGAVAAYPIINLFSGGLRLGGVGGGFGGVGGTVGAGSFGGAGQAPPGSFATTAPRATATATATATSATSSGFNITPIITPELFVLSVAIAMGVAIIAGIVPAYRASKFTPVEALRHE